jgi:hypothetical protein
LATITKPSLPAKAMIIGPEAGCRARRLLMLKPLLYKQQHTIRTTPGQKAYFILQTGGFAVLALPGDGYSCDF